MLMHMCACKLVEVMTCMLLYLCNSNITGFFIDTSNEVTETVLVKDLIYVFQGLDGKFIRFDCTKDSFVLDESVSSSVTST